MMLSTIHSLSAQTKNAFIACVEHVKICNACRSGFIKDRMPGLIHLVH